MAEGEKEMNKLTQDQLDMINRLQPFFKEKMGGWEHGDPCILSGIEDVYCEDCVGDNIYDSIYKKAIRVPKVYDWKNPERGLWGMVDWNKFYQELYGPDGVIAIYKVPFIEYNEEMGIPVKDHPLIVSDPFTALLKTLCEQEGV